MKDFQGLYGIADAGFGHPVELGRQLLSAGVCALQVRCKGWSEEEVARVLQALRPHARVPLIVNDFAGLAHLADGVHLGQDDGPFPTDAGLKGRSVHSLAQLEAALAEGVDHVGFGPVFGTATKVEAGSGKGVEALRAVVQASPVPVVAIGGITLERLPAVRSTGVACWAVISAIVGQPDVVTSARRFVPGVLPDGA